MSDCRIELDLAKDKSSNPGLTILDGSGNIIHVSTTWETTAKYLAFALQENAALRAENEQKDELLLACEQTRTPPNPIHAKLVNENVALEERIAELECLISNIGVCVGAYAVDLQEPIREAAGDFARGQLDMSRRVTRILDDEVSRQMNLYEANYLAGLDEYAKENATLTAEIERLHCIMLVLVGEAALALGDDPELVSRLRAIRERTIDEAAKAAKGNKQ